MSIYSCTCIRSAFSSCVCPSDGLITASMVSSIEADLTSFLAWSNKRFCFWKSTSIEFLILRFFVPFGLTVRFSSNFGPSIFFFTYMVRIAPEKRDDVEIEESCLKGWRHGIFDCYLPRLIVLLDLPVPRRRWWPSCRASHGRGSPSDKAGSTSCSLPTSSIPFCRPPRLER